MEFYLNKAAPTAHSLIVSTYNKMKADLSVGKTRAQSMALGNWGASTQRAKEHSGVLQTWTDGTMVRVGTASIFLHVLDLIVASHPVNGPARKARTPLKSFRKGHRQATLERKEGQAIRAP
jgi:hypothetical protein